MNAPQSKRFARFGTPGQTRFSVRSAVALAPLAWGGRERMGRYLECFPRKTSGSSAEMQVQILSKKRLHDSPALLPFAPLRVQAKGQLVCGPITVPLRGRD